MLFEFDCRPGQMSVSVQGVFVIESAGCMPSSGGELSVKANEGNKIHNRRNGIKYKIRRNTTSLF